MKIVGAIVIVIVFGFIGFVMTVIATFSRDAQFYVPFVPTVTVGLMVIIILGIYGKWKHKVTRISGLVFLSLCMLSVVIYEGYQAFLGNLEVVSTQDVDLSEYQPFAEQTKAVSLEEPS